MSKLPSPQSVKSIKIPKIYCLSLLDRLIGPPHWETVSLSFFKWFHRRYFYHYYSCRSPNVQSLSKSSAHRFIWHNVVSTFCLAGTFSPSLHYQTTSHFRHLMSSKSHFPYSPSLGSLFSQSVDFIYACVFLEKGLSFGLHEYQYCSHNTAFCWFAWACFTFFGFGRSFACPPQRMIFIWWRLFWISCTY